MVRVHTALAVAVVFLSIPGAAFAQLRVISSGGFRGAYLGRPAPPLLGMVEPMMKDRQEQDHASG